MSQVIAPTLPIDWEAFGPVTLPAPDPLWADPRPDLAVDTPRWVALLRAAHDLDYDDPYGVFGAVQGARILGARLEMVANGDWRLLPPEDMAAEEWLAFRQQWLMPRGMALRRLLAKPRERSSL